MPCDVLLQTDTPTSDTDFIFAFPCNTGTSSGGQWIRIGKGDADNKLSIRYNKGGGSGVLGPGIYQVYGVKF